MTMALFRYLRPTAKALDPQGHLSHSVPSVVISEVKRGKEGEDADEEARDIRLW